jgi:hypothetical protein
MLVRRQPHCRERAAPQSAFDSVPPDAIRHGQVAPSRPARSDL